MVGPGQESEGRELTQLPRTRFYCSGWTAVIPECHWPTVWSGTDIASTLRQGSSATSLGCLAAPASCSMTRCGCERWYRHATTPAGRTETGSILWLGGGRAAELIIRGCAANMAASRSGSLATGSPCAVSGFMWRRWGRSGSAGPDCSRLSRPDQDKSWRFPLKQEPTEVPHERRGRNP